MESKTLLKLVALANELNSQRSQDVDSTEKTYEKLKNIFYSLSYDTKEQRTAIDNQEITYRELRDKLTENQNLVRELNKKIKNEIDPNTIHNIKKIKNEIENISEDLNKKINEIKQIIDKNRNEIKAQKYIRHAFYFGTLGFAHFLYKKNLNFKEILKSIEYEYNAYFYHQALYLLIHSHLNIPFDYKDHHYNVRGKIARIVVSSSNSSLILEIEDIENLLYNDLENHKTYSDVDYEQILTIIKIQNLSLALLAYIEIDFTSVHERKVAHYTNLFVANKLLTGASPIRLNSTNFMNDPLEGVVFNNFINIHINNDINPHSHTFLTCFTFNHNSLNQFRLYGNIKNIECSGVSIVYDENFFSCFKPNSTNHPEKLKDFKSNRLSLFRCIYIDPVSGFIKVAQRNEYSFFQEYKDFETAKENLEEYKNRITLIEDKSQSILFLIKNLINSIHEESLVISKNINLIMRNIKFLFKHFSFQEEQECRIIRTENIESNNVIYDKNTRRSFIEYDPLNSNAYIRNVYIGKASSLYLTNIIKNISLLSTHMPKVKISENPYNVLEILKDIDLD